tara:strand:- start:3298 stop:4317 length:1020 start_codon:yes stop_codon:yes gene_type:complete
MILICGFLLWFNFFEGLFTIEWFVYSQTAAYLITLIVAVVAVINKSGKLKFNWNLPFFLLIVKRSAPFALLVLIMSFYNRLDSVLIERLLPNPLGKEQAGVYAQAFRLLDAGQNFALLFAVLLLPLFSKMISIRESVEKMVKLSFSIIISGSLIIAITSQFFATDLMQLMYGINTGETEQHYMLRISQSAIILKLLMFSFVAISTNYIFGTLLTANHNLKQLNFIALGGLVINLSLNLILIPYFYSIGSAWASLATQSVTALLQFLLVYKIFKFKISFKHVINLFVLIIVLITGGFVFTEFINLRWELSFILMLISGFCVSIVLKLLNVKEFISIIKEK